MFSQCLCDMGGCRVQGVDWQSPCFITSVHWPELHESQRGPQWFMWGKFPQSKTCRHQSLFPLWWHLKAQQTFCVCVHVRMCAHVSRQCVGEALASHGQHNNWTSKATNISSVILWRESSCKVNGVLIWQDPADEWGIKEDEEGNEDELRVLRLEQGKSGWEKDKHQ